MSDLQIGLLAIGVVVVVGVLAYNKWQEIRFRRDADARLRSGHEDVLMEEPAAIAPVGVKRDEAAIAPERREPTFAAATPASASDAVQSGPEPRDEDGAEGRNAAVPAPQAAGSLSESIDYIVAIESSDQIDGAAFLDAAAASLAGTRKPVRLEGYATETASWEEMRREGRYDMARAGMQLVDRNGPVSPDDLTTFGAAIQQAAASAGALASIPDRAEALNLAGDLDEFCGTVDILITLHLEAQATPIAGTKIRALAEANGFALEEDGRFRRRDDAGRVLYELASVDGTPLRAETLRSMTLNAIALELDVPRTPEPGRTFAQFRDLAQQLAQAMDGRIVNENRATVSSAAFGKILAQVEAVQGAMTARSIPPGGAWALRLFS